MAVIFFTSCKSILNAWAFVLLFFSVPYYSLLPQYYNNVSSILDTNYILRRFRDLFLERSKNVFTKTFESLFYVFIRKFSQLSMNNSTKLRRARIFHFSSFTSFRNVVFVSFSLFLTLVIHVFNAFIFVVSQSI